MMNLSRGSQTDLYLVCMLSPDVNEELELYCNSQWYIDKFTGRHVRAQRKIADDVIVSYFPDTLLGASQ